MAISKSVDPKSVWEYANRTLTQSRIPFWREVIVRIHNNFSISGGTSVTKSINIPSGETWDIGIITTYTGGESGSYIYTYLNGTDTSNMVYKDKTGGTYGKVYAGSYSRMILSDGDILYIKYYNPSGSSHNGSYLLSGYKLGTRIAKFKRVNEHILKPISIIGKKKVTEDDLPTGLKDLVEFARYDSDGDICIRLIDNIVTLEDEKRNVIERTSVDVKINDLVKNLEYFKNNPETSGWKDLFSYFNETYGIDLRKLRV